MVKGKTIRLSQAAIKLNVGTKTITNYLENKGFSIENKPNAKITLDQFNILSKKFPVAAIDKVSEVAMNKYMHDDAPADKQKVSLAKDTQESNHPATESATNPNLSNLEDDQSTKKTNSNTIEQPSEEPIPTKSAPSKNISLINKTSNKTKGLTILGKIELPKAEDNKFRQIASSDEKRDKDKKPRNKKPRKRIIYKKQLGNRQLNQKIKQKKENISEKEVQEKIQLTLAKLEGTKKEDNRAKYRKEKKMAIAESKEKELLHLEEKTKTLKVTEFVSANELASLMNVPVNEVLSACMALGLLTSINQRLDVETITIIADEFGYNVEFTSVQDEYQEESEEADSPKDLVTRAPIVTIMGHVDHGKTSLLDYIRNTDVTEQEAGGITQHIGAYYVVTEHGKKITFLDTPGHEAFTAMRARGAKLTDVTIIVIAADDSIMPQTKEAIHHAKAANVPIVIAINKIDKPQANSEKIKEGLSNIDILVESWGGKYQSQEISAKTGQGIDELLEKVLLEAELLALKANPNKNARGTVLETSLDKGKGYITNLMVQNGTLRIGDVILAGMQHGKIKAMFDYHDQRIQVADPCTPVQILGLDGPPKAGDTFRVISAGKEAREVATSRKQILREQALRAKRHITLNEVGRRLAVGNFQELNIILKGDVDGSIEALSEALLKLSIEKIHINIIHKGVGQISESDILLASSADAIVIGFHVRPSSNARKLAAKEVIEIRLYDIIYDAINDVKDAMQGMLAPSVTEITTGTGKIREIFKISKIGTVAGCYMTDDYIKKSNQVRLIRNGIVIYTGNIKQLKRFKEEVQEVKSGFEFGMSIENFNDIKVGDLIEGFEQQTVQQTL